MVSIYGPNETDSAFLTQISKTLLEEIDCPLVVGGDFNAVINPALDKPQSDTTANPSSKLLNKFITELNLIDLWRIQNTKAKDFTFFSNRHKTFSSIDYIFLSPSLISSNSSISILPILLSDHSAVLCNVPLSDVKAKSPRWRFNIFTFTFTFMHLADAFIQSDLHCIQVTVFTFDQLLLSLGIEPMILALLAPCSTI